MSLPDSPNADVVCLLQKESGLETYAAWYPPVQQTLMCLSKLYRCVEQRVFAGLAQDAVTSCTATVQVTLACPRVSRGLDVPTGLLSCI